jgi:hypothetical protein
MWRFETQAVREDRRQVVESYLLQWPHIEKKEVLLRNAAIERIVDCLDVQDELALAVRGNKSYIDFIGSFAESELSSLSDRAGAFIRAERKGASDVGSS